MVETKSKQEEKGEQKKQKKEKPNSRNLTDNKIYESQQNIIDGPARHWLDIEHNSLKTRIKQWVTRKTISEEDLIYIKEVAWDLSRVFPHRMLIENSTEEKGTKQGNPIHAYIFLHHPRKYRTLIFDNRVIDLACLYGIRNFRPDILKFISLEELKGLKRSIVYCELTPFENYPGIKFSRMLVYTKRSFYDSVAIEHDAEIDIGGWPSIGRKIYTNGALLSFIDYDLPVALITHTPGDKELYRSITIDTKGLQQQKEQVLTKLYHRTLGELASMEKKLDKAESFANSFAKVASHTIKEAGRKHNINWREKIENVEQERKNGDIKKEKRIKNWTPIIVALIVIIGTLTGIGLFLGFS